MIWKDWREFSDFERRVLMIYNFYNSCVRLIENREFGFISFSVSSFLYEVCIIEMRN